MDQGKGTNGNNASNDHLQNLCHRDPLRSEPLGFALDGHQKVVKVHDGVDSIVDGSVDDSGRGVGDHSMPRAKKHRCVVVPMEQDQGFLVHHNKKGIKEFTVSCR